MQKIRTFTVICGLGIASFAAADVSAQKVNLKARRSLIKKMGPEFPSIKFELGGKNEDILVIASECNQQLTDGMAKLFREPLCPLAFRSVRCKSNDSASAFLCD